MTKRGIAARVLMGLGALVVCAIVVGIVVVNTAAFRDYLRGQISKQAMAKFGARVEIESIETHWWALGADLNRVVVYGNTSGAASGGGGDADDAVLFRAARLEIGLRFWPLLRGRFEMSKLILDEPVVHLRIDSQGHSNIPNGSRANASGAGDPGPIFDLAIGELAIHSGEIYYNDAEIPLDAELHDLKFDAAYSLLTSGYGGSLAYDRGVIAGAQIRTDSPRCANEIHSESRRADFGSTRCDQRKFAGAIECAGFELREPAD